MIVKSYLNAARISVLTNQNQIVLFHKIFKNISMTYISWSIKWVTNTYDTFSTK